MTPQTWSAISNLLDEALELDTDRRIAWLNDLSRRDPQLAPAVRELLAAHAERETAELFDRPPRLAAAAPASGGPELAPGEHVGPYRLKRELGAGGMALVWLAERADGAFTRDVALKIPQLSRLRRDLAERFARERDILAQLEHPNIARLYDAGISADGLPYLALEYVEGVPLTTYCDERRLDFAARLRLFAQVLGAVQYAHANLIIHRDLKPSNILVTAEGQVRLLDFGVAKLLADDQQAHETKLTQLSGRALTPDYASPEQIKGESLTIATDVYSLGVVLYELLTGERPYRLKLQSAAQIEQAVVGIDPVRPSSAVTDAAAHARGTSKTRMARALGGDLDTIVLKALQKTPARRYGTAAELAEDLQRYSDGRVVLARPDSLGYSIIKLIRRHKVPMASAALIACAFIIATYISLRQAHVAKGEREFAYRELDRAQTTSDLFQFLIFDAAPSGAPFTARDLLERAEDLVTKQRVSDAGRADLLTVIGGLYIFADEGGNALRVLEQAYRVSRGVADPSVRAAAACALAVPMADAGEGQKAAALVREALRELPDEPRYAFDRAACQLRASAVARGNTSARDAVAQIVAAQEVLRRAPVRSAVLELRAQIELVNAQCLAGQTSDALAAAQQAEAELIALGRDQTETAGTFYNNFALCLQLLGRSREAEPFFRRAIDVSRAGAGNKGVSPMLMLNYSRALASLSRSDEALVWAEQAYSKAKQSDQPVVVNQALIALSSHYTARRDFARAQGALDEVEPRLRAALPDWHPAFAALASAQAVLAAAQGDHAGALDAADRSVDITRRAAKDGKEGASAGLPLVLSRRARIEIEAARYEAAERDAREAIAIREAAAQPGTHSILLGQTYLLLAQALVAQGRTDAARDAALHASDELLSAGGQEHPDTRAAAEILASLPR